MGTAIYNTLLFVAFILCHGLPLFDKICACHLILYTDASPMIQI